jgi:hypothetical protein
MGGKMPMRTGMNISKNIPARPVSSTTRSLRRALDTVDKFNDRHNLDHKTHEALTTVASTAKSVTVVVAAAGRGAVDALRAKKAAAARAIKGPVPRTSTVKAPATRTAPKQDTATPAQPSATRTPAAKTSAAKTPAAKTSAAKTSAAKTAQGKSPVKAGATPKVSKAPTTANRRVSPAEAKNTKPAKSV